MLKHKLTPSCEIKANKNKVRLSKGVRAESGIRDQTLVCCSPCAQKPKVISWQQQENNNNINRRRFFFLSPVGVGLWLRCDACP